MEDLTFAVEKKATLFLGKFGVAHEVKIDLKNMRSLVCGGHSSAGLIEVPRMAPSSNGPASWQPQRLSSGEVIEGSTLTRAVSFAADRELKTSLRGQRGGAQWAVKTSRHCRG
eukprot:symbB.v1.2.036799.t1/scaffold5281.1/size28962/1